VPQTIDKRKSDQGHGQGSRSYKHMFVGVLKCNLVDIKLINASNELILVRKNLHIPLHFIRKNYIYVE